MQGMDDFFMRVRLKAVLKNKIKTYSRWSLWSGVFLPLLALPTFFLPQSVHAESAPPAGAKHSRGAIKKAASAKSAPDWIEFDNGDKISGSFVRSVGDTITFHSDILGDLSIPWSKVKILHTNSNLAVLVGSVTAQKGHLPAQVLVGTLSMSGNTLVVHRSEPARDAYIPIKKARFVLDQQTMEKNLKGGPNWLQAWSGTLTGGATIVQATQQEHTFMGGVSLMRTVPTVAWLNTRSRTTIDFNGSYGKIKQPGYTVTSGDPAVTTTVDGSETKSAIYHADAEEDRYFSERFYALARTAFDHNYAQNLDLQQAYGGGLGWTIVKTPLQELDLKFSLQYEGQSFIAAKPGQNQTLFGSTIEGVYHLRLPHNMIFVQRTAFVPAFNNANAYSMNEDNALTIPFFKNLSLSFGTIDSYLNDPPATLPPTQKNSFQMTTGISYVIHSNY